MPDSAAPEPVLPHPPLRVEGGRLLVPIRVTPRAARVALTLEAGELRARLPAPPVEGAANAALVALLAQRLGISKRAIELVHGATARHKLVAISGLDAATFWRRALGERSPAGERSARNRLAVSSARPAPRSRDL